MRTPNIPFFNMKKKKHPKLSQICSYGIFFKGLKNLFERAVVNEPSVFEPLKFYCMSLLDIHGPLLLYYTSVPLLIYSYATKTCTTIKTLFYPRH